MEFFGIKKKFLEKIGNFLEESYSDFFVNFIFVKKTYIFAKIFIKYGAKKKT